MGSTHAQRTQLPRSSWSLLPNPSHSQCGMSGYLKCRTLPSPAHTTKKPMLWAKGGAVKMHGYAGKPAKRSPSTPARAARMKCDFKGMLFGKWQVAGNRGRLHREDALPGRSQPKSPLSGAKRPEKYLTLSWKITIPRKSK